MSLILVAIDGSEGSDRAIDYAARRAKADGAELLLANVVGGYGLPETIFAALTHDQSLWLKELLESESARTLTMGRDHALKAGAGTVLLESRTGEVSRTIIEIAKEKRAEAIVVGKSGMGHVAGALLGSVAQKLVALCTVPLTVVP
jgi:nucleotide-binding universal stress UspA family protein